MPYILLGATLLSVFAMLFPGKQQVGISIDLTNAIGQAALVIMLLMTFWK